MRHATRLAALCFVGTMLAGCAGGPTATTGADPAKPAGLSEKQVDGMPAVAGKWKGRLYAGPLNRRAIDVTVNADGSWTNVVQGAGKFNGTASVAAGKIQATSASTGMSYVWRLYEGTSQDAKKRVLVWLSQPDQRHIATMEFVGGR